MIIYSVTVGIDRSIEPEWFAWMLNTHIPDVMKTGYFSEYHMAELLEPIQDPTLKTYNIQYHCDSISKLQAYQKHAAPALQADHSEKFANKFVAFRTILKRLNP